LNSNNITNVNKIYDTSGIFGTNNQVLTSNGNNIYWGVGVTGPVGDIGPTGPVGADGPSGGSLPQYIGAVLNNGTSTTLATASTNYNIYVSLKATAAGGAGSYIARVLATNTYIGQSWTFQNTSAIAVNMGFAFYGPTGTTYQTIIVNNTSITGGSILTPNQTLRMWWNGTTMIGFKI